MGKLATLFTDPADAKLAKTASTFDIGWLKLLEVIEKLLRLNNLDLVVEDHTTYPLLKRVNGRLIINSNLDYRAWYLTKENLALLNYPYEEDFL
ncbi:hypothetical protein [Paenibacillus glacialis]|uniref:hypothetical protein n=1 Tax=Paenibacillus glacialis TaxID=494026 RepID=UPI000ADBBBE0|nr:hypothetical protein [Paenibacillus glacialis]